MQTGWKIRHNLDAWDEACPALKEQFNRFWRLIR